MEGDVALPRPNGELVFSTPWEGRAFGIAVALKNAGLYHRSLSMGRVSRPSHY